MEPKTLFIDEPNRTNITEVTTTIAIEPIITNNVTIETNITNNVIIEPSITSNDKNIYNTVIEPKTSVIIKESSNIALKTNSIDNDSSSIGKETKTTVNIESTTINKIKTNYIINQATTESINDNEPKLTNNGEEKTNNNIIEQSITSKIEDNYESDETIPTTHVNKKSEDNSKATTIAIVFSILGGIVILGGIIGFSIYYKKTIINNININKNEKNTIDILKNYKV